MAVGEGEEAPSAPDGVTEALWLTALSLSVPLINFLQEHHQACRADCRIRKKANALGLLSCTKLRFQEEGTCEGQFAVFLNLSEMGGCAKLNSDQLLVLVHSNNLLI